MTLPYIEVPDTSVGPLRLSTWGLMVVSAIVAGYFLFVGRCRWPGARGELASRLYIWVVVGAYIGAHTVAVLARPSVLLREPLELVQPWRSGRSLGGLLGGLMALAVLLRLERVSRSDGWKYLDHAAFILPPLIAVGRAACAWTHHHPGVASRTWLAVSYPSGPRYDLALLEAMSAVLVTAVFLLLDRRARPPGFYLALFSLWYGILRLALDRVEILHVAHFGWTLNQWGGVGAILLGLGALFGLAWSRYRAAVR